MTHKDADIADDQRHSLGGESMVPAHYDWYMMRRRRLWRPPTDVYETDEHVVVKIEIAGVSSDDFKITFVDHRLIIAGRRRDPVGKLIYQNMEIRYGEFRSEVWIGWALDQAVIEASYEDGFLFVKLPKAREHHIQVQVRNGNEI